MAHYEHLPIYREAFKFLIYCETIVQHFSRYHKYTHGSDLRNTARTVVKLIIRANNQSDKEQVLEKLRVTIEEIKVIVRICKEVKAFNSFNSFETAINQVTDISRQAEGWLKSARKKRLGQNPEADGLGPGKRNWNHQSNDNNNRALPVRSGK